MPEVVLPNEEHPITVVFTQLEFDIVLQALELSAITQLAAGNDDTAELIVTLRQELWTEEEE